MDFILLSIVASEIFSFIVSRYIFKWRVSVMEKKGKEAYPGLASFLTFITWNAGGWFGGYKAIGILGFIASLISSLIP